MPRRIVELTLASAVATGGTFNVSYPDGFTAGHFENSGFDHRIYALGAEMLVGKDFTIAFSNASYAVVTYQGATTLPAGTKVYAELDLGPGKEFQRSAGRMFETMPIVCNLGAPIATDNDALIDAATGAELPDGTTTSITYTPSDAGTSPVDGANTTWVLDVPRNVIANVTHGTSIVAMTIKVTGKDEYGVTMYEELTVTATGTSKDVAGAKAFAEVTSIELSASSDATANTVNIGFGLEIGIPVFVGRDANVRAKIVDGTLTEDPASDITPGDQSIASATTGDVRGTLTVAGTDDDGLHGHTLILENVDPDYLGAPQYAA